MAIYRNYNSSAEDLFSASKFSSNSADLINFLKGVDADGGYGNQAIENLYNHILNFQEGVDQLIVISDAAGNSAEETKKIRLNKTQAYWRKYPRFERILNGNQLVEELAQRRIPIHSFYINDPTAKDRQKTKLYFTKVSQMTGGRASQYNISGQNAASDLTSFVVENILNKVGGEQLGEELVTAYRMRFM